MKKDLLQTLLAYEKVNDVNAITNIIADENNSDKTKNQQNA